MKAFTLIKIGAFSGIPVKIHWTFFIALVVVYFYPVYFGAGIEAQLIAVSMFLSFFLCVVLHEFGHAFAARRYGAKTRHIIVTPIAGFAQLNKLLVKPVEEFVVAIAGPLVNIGIALTLFLYLYLFSDYPVLENFKWPPDPISNVNSFLMNLFLLNFGLGLLNLIPAFPLDGGRMLRALLSTKFEITKSTKYAVIIGGIFSFALGVYGIYVLDFILVFVAIFIIVSGGREYQMMRTLGILEQHTVSEIMKATMPISITDHIEYVKHRITTEGEKYLIVVDDDEQIVGILFEETITRTLETGQTEIQIEEIISKKFQVVPPNMNLSQAYQKMEEEQLQFLLVFDSTFLGTVDVQGIDHFLHFMEEKKNEKKMAKTEDE